MAFCPSMRMRPINHVNRPFEGRMPHGALSITLHGVRSLMWSLGYILHVMQGTLHIFRGPCLSVKPSINNVIGGGCRETQDGKLCEGDEQS